MKISVVIPVFNAEAFIANTVKAVLNQGTEGFFIELITVNDGSKDGTKRILESFKDQLILINQENRGPAAARNAGARAASGDIIVFTDSDTIPQPNWLINLYRVFKNENVKACAGSYCIANSESSLSRIIQSEIEFRYKSFNKMIRFAGTYNLAVTREVFHQTGGFDEAYRQASGEDNDFCYKIGKTGNMIRFVEEAKVAHFHTEKPLKYLKEQYRHGFWRARLYFEHPDKMGGDDYTFWKDIVEPPLAILGVFLAAKSLLFRGKQKHVVTAIPFGILFLLEMWQAQQLKLSSKDRLYAVKIMFFRAFWRTAGFVYGIFNGAARFRCKKKSA
jgi:glycosyltransferase involved in cell wall biosynthesis